VAVKKISYNYNYKCKQTAMLVVCGLQPAADDAAVAADVAASTAAAEAEDEGVEEKTNKSNFLMVARLSH
jgi:hypothetical protein